MISFEIRRTFFVGLAVIAFLALPAICATAMVKTQTTLAIIEPASA